jgi:hypothetical protein
MANMVLGSQRRAYLAILVRELERINQPQRLIHAPSNRQIIDSDLPHHTMRVDQKQSSESNTLLLNQDAIVFADTVVLVREQWDVNLAQPTIFPTRSCPRE